MRFICLVLICLFLPCLVCGESSERYILTDAGLDLGIHSVHYPRIEAAPGVTLTQEEMSRLETAQALLTSHLSAQSLTARMAAVLSLSVPLRVTWEGTLANDLLSVHLHATGPVLRERSESLDDTACLDLLAMREVTMDDFFEDPSAGRSRLEQLLEDEVAPSMSPHLMACELLPLPDAFYPDAFGLTLYYPSERLQTLSGNAGGVRFFWYELSGVLDLSEGSVPERLGARETMTCSARSAQAISACVQQGAFPCVPVTLGDALADVLAAWPPLSDPDNIEGARLFSPEGAAFRDIFLVTDNLSVNRYDSSLVEAIRADRMNLYGLCTGETTQAAWREILGAPDATVTLSPEAAELQRLCAGSSDYYAFGDHLLRLHADESDVLRTLFLQ